MVGLARLQKGEPFTIDGILEAADTVGDFHPARGNVRTQMAVFVTNGLLERVSQGKFKLTQEGSASVIAEMQARQGPASGAAQNLSEAPTAAD